jgi:hypothetical protein
LSKDCFAAALCLGLGTTIVALAQPGQSDMAARDISKVTIQGSQMGWSSEKANLTLVRSNAQFVGTLHSVPEAVVSNLLAVMRGPPRTQIDPDNLGLTPAWLQSNRDRLLTAFGGETSGAIFPLASPRQRAWLTNALFDLNLLGGAVRDSVNRFWTDDHPEIRIGFDSGDRAVAQLHSRMQMSFMLPWEVTLGTNIHTSYDAGISRAVASLLPSGFLNRKRIQGDLLSIIKDGFAVHSTVQQQIKQMTLEETLGAKTDRFLREYELTNYAMHTGNNGRFPDGWMATLHRTNWPGGLVMPVHSQVEQGVVRLLPRLLDSADARVRPILQSSWVVGILRGGGTLAIEVDPEGTMANDPYLRGHMAKVGLGELYDEIKPLMEHGLAFTLREGTGFKSRTSEWILLLNGKLVLVKFSGDGVLGWSPQELGFRGREGELRGNNYNMVGVFLTPEGQIEKVVPQAGR